MGIAAYRHIVKERGINRSRRRGVSPRSIRTWWRPRACVRRLVALRVDYATADGRVWLGMVRNLSLQGMFIDSALRHVAHEVATGELLTVAFALPSGQACKLRAVVVHGNRHGCGVQFLEGHPDSRAQLVRYWSSLEEAQ